MKRKGLYSIFIISLCIGATASAGMNFEDEPVSTSSSTFNYVIITQENHLGILSDFIMWKESLGFNVQVETTSYIDNNYQGGDLAEKIRNYLIQNYIEWNIQYVLIIGSRNTIPMRICIPFSEYHENQFLQCPTDYYYADLTGDWDADRDGFFGEYQDDTMDFYPEIIVGRIPCDDSNKIKDILQRTINYESDNSEWKKNVLLPGAIIFYKNQEAAGYTWERSDGATLMEKCRLDIFEPNGYTCTRMYEEKGLRLFTYAYDIPLNKENVFSEWSKNYGIVNMLGHATNRKIDRLVWEKDDGDNIPVYPGELVYTTFLSISDSDKLTLEIPPIVYTSGCTQLFSLNNMGRSFICDGAAVAFIGTTQGSWYDECLKWDDESDGGTYSLNYFFFHNLVYNQQSLGNALYSSKIHYLENFWYNRLDKNWIFRSYDNMYSLTLYGDPSLSLNEPSNAPEKPTTPQGPDSGKIKDTYTYKTVSIDPEGDQIRYLFNWGDGTSTLSDYYTSGQEISVSHTWNKQGNYDIRARCQDIHGSFSPWSDPLEVAMPKFYSDNPLFHLLLRCFDRFAFLYSPFLPVFS
ncbi:MAG: C25 family cysteine peptidase [Candidatus Thermoplasmatota archaeon]|nr:C25 family cysteine peptidase [Candidatus Thermoplasmatota archaeon]